MPLLLHDTTAELKKKVLMDGASSHHKYLDFINKHEDHITMNNKWNNEKLILKSYSNFMT